MFYDALNRVKSRTYSDNAPAVTYKYDGQSLPSGAPEPSLFDRGYSTGRLVAVTYGGTSAGNYTGYDGLGRANVSFQQTDSQNYRLLYGYNLASQMTSEKYPSGKEIRTTYDTAGRLNDVKRYINNVFDKTYASAFSYTAHGAQSSMTLGNNLVEKTEFNNRLQPTFIKLGTTSNPASIVQFGYEYNTSGQSNNNGNVLKQTITIPGSPNVVMTQNYGYDALNRLQSASENSGANWSQSYSYDRYGNRWMSGYIVPGNESLTPQMQSHLNAANNRIVLSGFGYDDAGNLTSDPRTPPNGIVYDAENRQIRFNGAAGQYFYDGDGRRVKKIDGSGTTVFVYNAGGQLIAEYHSDPVPPAVGGGGTSYLTSDHLGSTRVVTSAAGAGGKVTVKARYDYLPFGEEIGSDRGSRTLVTGYGANDGTRQKFTQKERDNESGLDYFLARYYSSAQGRFTSPDPYLIILEKEKGKDENEREQILRGYISQPQVWNKYVYVLNNPLKHIDPDGRRELTAEDQKRLAILWDQYYTAKASTDPQINSQLAPAIIGAISEIVAAIKDVVEGDADPPNLRAVEFAIDNIGNTNYGDKGTVSNGVTVTVGSGQNKCNIFCANAYAIGALLLGSTEHRECQQTPL